MPPAVHRRRRHAESGRGRLLRHPFRDRLRQRQPPRRSELGITVHDHPGPPLSRESLSRPTASGEARTYFRRSQRLWAGQLVRTISTEHGAWWEILFGTEPSRNRLAPVIPLLPTTIRSELCSSATSRIASAASPWR